MTLNFFFSLLVTIIPHGTLTSGSSLAPHKNTQVFNLKIRSFRSSFKFVSMRSWHQPLRGNINYYYWTSWLFRTFSGVFVFVFQIICLFGFIINSWAQNLFLECKSSMFRLFFTQYYVPVWRQFSKVFFRDGHDKLALTLNFINLSRISIIIQIFPHTLSPVGL